MITQLERIREGFRVIGIDDARNVAKTPAFQILLKNATSANIGGEGDKSEFRHQVRLAIENHRCVEQEMLTTPCKWVQGYALCRNPYPTVPSDKWLLVRADGTAFFAAATPVLCRIYLHCISEKLQTA